MELESKDIAVHLGINVNTCLLPARIALSILEAHGQKLRWDSGKLETVWGEWVAFTDSKRSDWGDRGKWIDVD